jgi:hypothetical protein
LNKAGHANDAEPLFHRAISIGEKALGRTHSLTQRYASHYARLLLDTARAAEALPVARAALATHEAASGVRRGKAALSSGCKSHPVTAAEAAALSVEDLTFAGDGSATALIVGGLANKGNLPEVAFDVHRPVLTQLFGNGGW